MGYNNKLFLAHIRIT